MSDLSDRALDHLRQVSDWPDLSGTRYELRHEVARGGMGVVYVAHDRELERDVALKVLAPELADPETSARLTREARLVARLEHPGIVPVHDAGTLPDGRVFYAMKLVAGKRLDELLREATPLRERVRLLLRIAEPVSFAHAHGVVHRDLKPENVMVGPFGEVLVMDWGVAKHCAEPQPPQADAGLGVVPQPAPNVTAHGTVIGTPAYMAPEQARGDVELVDARADVYALGAILYFMLTGVAPGRRSASPDAVTRSWIGYSGPRPSAVTPPHRVAAGVPRPLEAICLKALAPEPDGRYAEVEALAADLAHFLEAEPVSAFPEGPWRRTLRFASRYRTPILLVLAYLLMRAVLLLVARV